MPAKVTIPPMPITGGCQCGQARYVLSGLPVVFYLCHCTECQRHTSSAFGESLRVRAGDLEFTGEMSATYRSSESGTPREGRFCPQCGVRLIHGSVNASEFVNIKAGTLDDTSWLVPAGHIWVRSKQPFMRFCEDELCYDRQPPDNYAALIERWRAMTDMQL